MASSKTSISKIFVWILMGLLFVGLAGFGATNLSGTARNIGSVGDKQIGVTEYFRALQNELRAAQAQAGSLVRLSEPRGQALQQQVLSTLVTAKSLDHEAAQMGISVGDAVLADQLAGIAAFQGADGQFNREAYRFALQNAGLNESEFEADLRDETARTLLQGAVLSGANMPDAYVDTLLAFAGELRVVTWASIGPDMLAENVPEPTNADLRAQYDENPELYVLPEQKRITYLWLTPEMILDTVVVDDARLREAYDSRTAEFNQPERRLVERLVFADDAAAQAARDAIDAGTTDFETLVSQRGLDLADVDMGDVSRIELGPAGERIFATPSGQIAGPLPSDLGPALYRINAVLPAQDTPFEDARELLIDDIALDQARRNITALAEGFNDQLAGGATLEELAETTDAELGTIDWSFGVTGAIAAYESFREAAAEVTPSDFPEVAGLGDGGLFAIRLNEVLPPRPEPFAQITGALRDDWLIAETTRRLLDQAETLRAQLEEGRTFEGLELDPEPEETVTRGSFVRNAPEAFVASIFDLQRGGVALVPGSARVVLVRLDAINAAERDSEDAQALAQVFRDQASAALAQDLFGALAGDVQSRIGLELNQTAMNAVHTQFP